VFKAIGWVFGLIALSAFIYMTGPLVLFDELLSFGWFNVLIWLGLTLLARAFSNHVVYFSIRSAGFKPKWLDLYFVAWLKTFYNSFVPGGGVAYFSYFVKRSTGMTVANLFNVSVPVLFSFLCATGFLGLVVASLCAFFYGRDEVFWLLVFLIYSIFPLFYFLFKSVLVRFFNESMMLAFGFIFLLKLCAINLAAAFFRTFRVCFVFFVLHDVSKGSVILDISLVSLFSDAAFFVGFVPGGMGVREFLSVLPVRFTELNVEEVMLVFLVERMLILFSTIFMFFFGFLWVRLKCKD